MAGSDFKPGGTTKPTTLAQQAKTTYIGVSRDSGTQAGVIYQGGSLTSNIIQPKASAVQLQAEIAKSIKQNPDAWAKATGTTDQTKQFTQVSGLTPTQAKYQLKKVKSAQALQTPSTLLSNVQDAKTNLAYSVALKREQEIQNRLMQINIQLKEEQDRIASKTGQQTADPEVLESQSAKYTALMSEKEKASKELVEEKNKIIALESGNLITSAEQSFSGIQNINPMTKPADTTPMELPTQDPTQRIVEWEGAKDTIIDPKFTGSLLGQDISPSDQKVFTDTATLDMSSMIEQGKSLEDYADAVGANFPKVDASGSFAYGKGQTLEGYMESLGKTTTNLGALDAQPVKSEVSDAQKKINKKIDAGMSPKDAFMVVAKEYNKKGVYLTQSGKVVEIASAPSPLVPQMPSILGETRDKEKYSIDPLSKEGQTVQKQYAQQFENQIKNIAQTEYFLAVREGRVGIGQALFKPEGTLIDQFYTDEKGKLRTSMPTEQYEITKTYLEERGMSMDTPIGMIKTSPMVYEEAKSQVEKYMTDESKEMGFLEPPKDWTKPPTQPDGTTGWSADFTPYTTTPAERVKELTKQAFSGAVDEKFSYYQPSEFANVGIETTPPESITTETRGELRYGTQTPFEFAELKEQGGEQIMPGQLTQDETTSQLSSMSIFPEAMASSDGTQMSTPPPQTDWLGGEIREIPDDVLAQIGKGFTAEAFNIGQAGTQLATGKEVEYAPTLFGGLMDSVAQAGEGIQYKEYDSWFKAGFGNIGTAVENLGIFVDKAQTPEFQEKLGENLGKLGADIQKYPVYYTSSGVFEIGTLFIPVGKIGLGARIGTEVLKIGTTGTKGQKLTQLKNVISDIKYGDEKRVLATVKQIIDPKATIKIESGGIILGLGKKKVVTTVGELTPQELKIAQTSGKVNIDDLILNPNLKRSPGVQQLISDLPKLDKQTLQQLTAGFDNMPLLTVKPKITTTASKTTKLGKKGVEETTETTLQKESADIIEQAGKGQYFLNLGLEGTDPGMAVMVVTTSKAEPYPTGFISKEFDPVKVPDKMIVGGAGKPEQVGTVTWVKKGLFGADADKTAEAGLVQRTMQESVSAGLPDTASLAKMGRVEEIIDPKIIQSEKWEKLGEGELLLSDKGIPVTRSPAFIEQPLFIDDKLLKKTFPSQDPTTYGAGLAGEADKVKPQYFRLTDSGSYELISGTKGTWREQLKMIFGKDSISYAKIQNKLKKKNNKLIQLRQRLNDTTRGTTKYTNLLAQIRKLKNEIKVLESADRSQGGVVFQSTKVQDFGQTKGKYDPYNQFWSGVDDRGQYKKTADIVQFNTFTQSLERGADNIRWYDDFPSFTNKKIDLGTGNLKVTLPKGVDPSSVKKINLGKDKPFDLSPPGSPSSPKVIQTAKEVKPDKPKTDLAKTKAVLREQAGPDTVPFRVTDYTPIPAPAISPLMKIGTPTMTTPITAELPKIDTSLGTGLIPDLSIKTGVKTNLGLKTDMGLSTMQGQVQSLTAILGQKQGLKTTTKQKLVSNKFLMPRYTPTKLKPTRRIPKRPGWLPFGNIMEKTNFAEQMMRLKLGKPSAKMIWAAPEKWFDAEGYYYKGKKGEQSAYRMMGQNMPEGTDVTKIRKKTSTTIQTQVGDSLGIFKI